MRKTPALLAVLVSAFGIPCAASASSGRIAYVLGVAGTQIYRTAPGVAGAKRLSGNVWPSTDPVVSPNGRKLLYAAAPDGGYDIYVRGLTSGDPVDLTPKRPGDDYQGAWSPDGKRIAFIGARGNARPQLFVMTADGSGAENPSWSLDGKQIAFARGFAVRGAHGPAGNGPQRDEIWVMTASGGGLHRVAVACDDSSSGGFPVCGGTPQPQWGR